MIGQCELNGKLWNWIATCVSSRTKKDKISYLFYVYEEDRPFSSASSGLLKSHKKIAEFGNPRVIFDYLSERTIDEDEDEPVEIYLVGRPRELVFDEKGDLAPPYCRESKFVVLDKIHRPGHLREGQGIWELTEDDIECLLHWS